MKKSTIVTKHEPHQTISRFVNEFIKNKMKKTQKQVKQMEQQQDNQAKMLFESIDIQNPQQSSQNQSEPQQQNNGERQSQDQQADSNAQRNKRMQVQIKSILKNTDIRKIIAQKKKKVTFADQTKEGYLILENGRKWNQRLKNQRKGKFDPQQKRLLIQSLSQALNQDNLTFDQIVRAMSEDDQKIPRNLHFWSKVCSILPDRCLSSSYKFLKRQLSSKNKGGDWTQDEVAQLEQLVNKYGRKWSMIAKQMSRTAQNIRDKYRLIGQQKYNPNDKETFWKFEEIIKYLAYLQKYSRVEFLDQKISQEIANAEMHDKIQLDQMKKRRYNSKTFNFHNNEVVRKYINEQFKQIKIENVSWQKISDKLQNKTIFDCRNKFVQLLQLQICGAGSKQFYQSRIVNFVSTQNVNCQSQIKWEKWNNENISIQQAKNRWMILKRHIQGRGQKTFKQIVQVAKQKYKQKNQK